MATFNGRQWIDEQVDSILRQEDVDVTLIISDDGSRDGTREHMLRRSSSDPRIEVMDRRAGEPGVTANFLHLFTHCEVPPSHFVALSDQDDIWHPRKLADQIEIIRRACADAVSSSVVSFDASGRRNLVVKSRPQRRWDYIFEAGGPGSTYVFTGSMHARLVEAISRTDTSAVGVHDWLLYAMVRAMGRRWVIDGRPTVEYRQHGDNVQGQHLGIRAFRSRLSNLRSGFYRRQFQLIALIVRRLGAPVHDRAWLADLDGLISDLSDRTLRGRLSIWRRRREIRRDPREGRELAAACVLGIW